MVLQRLTALVIQTARIVLRGNALTLTARAVGASLTCGLIGGAIAGAALFLPVALGIAAFGCIATGGAYVLLSTTAMSGRHKGVIGKDRFGPFIRASKGTALCGMAFLAGAITVTEMRARTPAISEVASTVFRPPATPASAFIPSSAWTAASPRH